MNMADPSGTNGYISQPISEIGKLEGRKGIIKNTQSQITYRTSRFSIQSDGKIHLIDKGKLFTYVNLQEETMKS